MSKKTLAQAVDAWFKKQKRADKHLKKYQDTKDYRHYMKYVALNNPLMTEDLSTIGAMLIDELRFSKD